MLDEVVHQEGGRRRIDLDGWDRVAVQVRFVSTLDPAVDPSEIWTVETSGSAWRREWLTEQVADLSFVQPDGSTETPWPFTLDVRERRTEWGASSAVVDVVLTLMQDQASNALWVAVGVIGHHLARLLKNARGRGDVELDLTDDAARQEAKSAVMRFADHLSWGNLAVRSVEATGGGSVTVEVRDAATGTVYTVDVKRVSGHVRLARVRKVTESGAT
jgi:hypothetical protein